MNVITIGGAVALSLLLVACGGSETEVTENRHSAQASEMPEGASQIHSATGIVNAVTGDQVTIAHTAIASAGWPAMTMNFKSPTGVPQSVQAGKQVNFSFRQDEGGHVLTSIQPR